MGTRNLICVFYKGRFIVAQYTQFDGYPEGQGFKILNFLFDPVNIARLKEGLKHIIILDQDGLHQVQSIVKQEMESQPSHVRSSTQASRKMVTFWPSLARETGGEILEIIAQASPQKHVPIFHDLEFANDSFCEWAYVVDLDTNMLEVYSGCVWKRDATNPRFNDVGDPDDTVPGFMRAFSLSELPNEEEFIRLLNACIDGNESDCDKGQEEDEEEEGGEGSDGGEHDEAGNGGDGEQNGGEDNEGEAGAVEANTQSVSG
jgi:hypothetical protein